MAENYSLLTLIPLVCTIVMAMIVWRRHRNNPKYRWLIYGYVALIGYPVGWLLLSTVFWHGTATYWYMAAGSLILFISLFASGIFVALFFYTQITKWLKARYNKSAL